MVRERQYCEVNQVSSRVCQRGTKCCVVDHIPFEGTRPAITSSYRVHGGSVEEVTWTREDAILRAKRWNRTTEDTLTARLWLRSAARQGMIVSRRHPEHGWWEYGPQWRAKDFNVLLDAAQAVHLLGGGT